MVSNRIVMHFLRRCVWIAFIGAFGALILVLIASQIGQRVFRKRAERLLAQAQFLELGKTSLQDAKRQFNGWKGKFDDQQSNEVFGRNHNTRTRIWIFVPRSTLRAIG